MKVQVPLLTSLALLGQFTEAVFVPPKIVPKTTFTNPELSISEPTNIVKRNAEPKNAIVNKVWLKEESEKLHGTTSETPKPWLRTIYGTVVEVVTPYVVGGVTFAAPQPTSTDGLEPWISIKKDGLPKTIYPKLKNGKIQNGFPDVKTYYQTATTIVHEQKDLKAHNLNEGDTIEEVKMIDEDDTYVKLSPIQRCTPDYYYNKGIAGTEKSEPFCSPGDHQKMRVGATYFLTWYTRFFKDVEKVRFHYAYVNEKAHDKGFDKRDLLDQALKNVDAEIEELSGNIDYLGDIRGAFYSSNWIDNSNGWYSLEVDKKWLRNKVYKKVVIAIQPDSIPDEDFSILDAPHLFATFQLRESVGKNTHEMRKLRDQGGSNDDAYYIIASIPTMVLIAVFGMYFFLHLNRKHRDLSHIKKPKKSRFGNQGRYNIPVAATDIRKPGKQS
jgi:hypothetical protein